MNTTRIVQLSAVIAEKTLLIANHLRDANLPQPSFEPNANGTIPQSLDDVREAILEATCELQDLLLGPTDLLHRHEANHLVSLHAIYRYEIAKSFPVGEEASFAQIAKVCGLSEYDTRRFIRHAITKRIFDEPRKGIVVHTEASRLLAEDQEMIDWVGALCEEMLPAALHVVDAMQKWPDSQEPEQTDAFYASCHPCLVGFKGFSLKIVQGFSLAYKTDNAFYAEMNLSPTRGKRFGSAMGTYAKAAKGMESDYVLKGYDWGAVKKVVDIGGAQGQIGSMLVSHHPHLQVVVQDLANTLPASAKFSPHCDGAGLQFMAHSFFEKQPVADADVYFFRMIFHNWSDKYCKKIIDALVPSLKTGAHVLIQDYALPDPKTIPFWKEKAMRAMDLTMLGLFNARERESSEWVDLFQSTDARFEVVGITQPSGSALSLMHFRWRGEQQ